MKATDLMIGDWVQSFGEPHKIIGIRTDTPYPYIKTDMSDTWYEWGLKDLADGIPLTPEILEKNGFTKDSGGEELYSIDFAWLIDVGYGFEMFISNDEKGEFNGIKKYVYELQHALRLCGIEKEIEL